MRVRWTKPAADDLTCICDYTLEHFGAEQAYRTAIAIYEGADFLGIAPERGRKGRKPGTREVVIRGLPFVMIYRLSEYGVEVLRILHGAQKWP